MENVSYIGLSGQVALHRLMEVTANNMANMNTPGFKSENVLFNEYLSRDKNEGEQISQVKDSDTYRDLAQGAMTQTANDLDFAIQGDGWFAVQTPAGIKYTRAGSFTLNDRGELVTQQGYQVMSDSSGPLTIPQGAAHILMTEQGGLSTEQGAVGKVKITSFENLQKLVPIGGNLYDAQGTQEKAVETPHVVQGMIENSNVQPILEMNKMMEILRMYQASQNMLLNDHERQRSTIQRLTKV
jgi:flagellar basal-body rod protein FlgF